MAIYWNAWSLPITKNRDDVVVEQAGRSLGFGKKPVPRPGHGGSDVFSLGNQLQCHCTLEDGVMGLEDQAHGAHGNEFIQSELVNAFTDEVVWR